MNKVEIRRKKILDQLSLLPIATITELAEFLSVSLETIRKDLEVLAERGLIVKVHGGAALADGVVNTNYDLRTTISSKEKKKIAKEACKMISPGDSVILESSTTNLELSKVLLQNKELLKTLIIITNSFNIATIFDNESPCSRMFFLGGWVNTPEHSTKGQNTAKALEGFHVEKAFISAASISDELMLTSYYDEDMLFQSQAIASAKTSVLLADSSKYHRSGILSVCPVSSLDYIVTDIDFSHQEQEQIQKFNTKIVKV